jgi:hypothetical protein
MYGVSRGQEAGRHSGIEGAGGVSGIEGAGGVSGIEGAGGSATHPDT